MDNDEEGARLTQREENRELIAKHRATVEPRGCPTPGACSCPGAIPDAETPVTDAVVKMHEAGWLSLGSSAPGAVKPLVEALEAFERELIDIKGRLLPQYMGRAERAENAKRMAEHERDALLEQLIVHRTTIANLHDVIDGMREKLRAATTMVCEMTEGVATWAEKWRESK